jgi:riboflavin kinase/FMN adenylyltransferase
MIPKYELIGKQNPTKPVVAIGNFDGVHCGHQEILNHLKDAAKSKNVDSVVITLDKHPQNVLHPEKNLKVLTTKEEKIKILTSMGIDTVIVIEFNPQTVMMDAEEFYYALLEGKLEASGIVIGYDHAFGHDRKGDGGFLSKLAEKTGIEVVRVNPAMEGEAPISSTKIREKILNGNCEEAARLLGRPYRLTGIVEKGFGRGQEIGFPTANINPLPIKPIPLDGVYAVKVCIDEKLFGGMMSIGENVTFGETKKTMEVNIFDFCENIYGKEIEVEFVSRIRDMQKFDNVDELKNRLCEDERVCRGKPTCLPTGR